MIATVHDRPVNAATAGVLLVEDDDIMRLSLEDRLRLEGIPLRAVASLAEAEDVLAHHTVDLVVTDIRLPDGNGRDLFTRLRQRHAGVPVVLMTGYGTIAEAVDLVRQGAADYLTKPFRMDAFMDLVKRLLAERRDVATLADRDGNRFHAGDGVLGPSPAMRRIEHLWPVSRHWTVPSSSPESRAWGRKWWRTSFTTTAHAVVARWSRSTVGPYR